MSAHSEIYTMFSPAVFTLAMGICRNRECAEDVLHNSFIKLIDKVSSFEGRAPFGMWFRQIAVNEALMYLRKKKKHQAVVPLDDFSCFDEKNHLFASTATPADSSDRREQQHDRLDVEKLLQRLPDHVRLVVWLKEVEGYTHEEIAQLVNKTPSYSKSIVLRAYKFLRGQSIAPQMAPAVGKH